MRVRIITAAVAAAIIAVLAPAAPADAAAKPTGHTRVLRDCVHTKQEPTRIIIACGDGNVSAVRLHYKHWGTKYASGHGSMYLNTCKPSCATGRFKRYPMWFKLTRPKHTSAGRLFSRLNVRFKHTTPYGHKTAHWSLPTNPL